MFDQSGLSRYNNVMMLNVKMIEFNNNSMKYLCKNRSILKIHIKRTVLST